jgi:ribosomal protein S18 acetylase RimI-like enzyme
MRDDTVRRARPDDTEVLLDLVAEYCAADDHAFAPDRVRAALAPLLVDDTHGQVWVHLGADGRPDGYLVVTWSWSLESGGAECLIDELYVRQRRRGHGRALVARALTAADERGCRVAFLETEADNDGARAFYGALGFTRERSVWLSRPLS